MRGIKTIEYRSNRTNVRGIIYIYASLGRYYPETEADMLNEYSIFDVRSDDLPRGVLVGTVELFDCDGGEWYLRNPQRLAELLKPLEHPQPVWFYPFVQLKPKSDKPVVPKPRKPKKPRKPREKPLRVKRTSYEKGWDRIFGKRG